MRVLLLPHNISSQIDVMVRAFRDLGVEARGLVYPGKYTSDEHCTVLPERVAGRGPRWAARAARKWALVADGIRWADVVHWHFGPASGRGLDLELAARLGRKRFVEFWGSDIRVPSIEGQDNPWYAEWVDAEESARMQVVSRRNQALFSGNGAEAVVSCPALARHLDPASYRTHHRIRQRLFVPDYVPRYPDPQRTRPVLLHTPSRPSVKGTPHVELAVERLRARYDIDFRLVHGVPRAEVLRQIADCDIYLDQFILGSHGLAAMEAMAFGKPVFCYINPAIRPEYPDDMPIVSCPPDAIEAALAPLLEHPERRTALGRLSRAYVEREHDAHTLCRRLLDIYRGG
jgi:hypothetical protein